MKISTVQPVIFEKFKPSEEINKPKTNFQDLLNKAISEVNDLQLKADAQVIGFAAGQTNIDIHDVMIGMEQAHLALQLTIEVRNKVIEAYQEIMRMQL
ncbi:MAG: flagellar hook-basal body complex protein FliE [Clostridia bacterium]|nr:flagellar hook-basal body complex protein FliE [Clostridia bacterium]